MKNTEAAGIRAQRQPGLKWLFLAILMPGLVAAVLLSYQYFVQQRERFEEELLRTARALNQAVDRELAAGQGALQALAASRSLTEGDLAGFHELAQSFLSAYPADNVVLVDPDGQQLLNLQRPFGEALPRTPDPDLIRRVLENRRPEVSGLFRGNVLNRTLVAYGVPVFRGGTVAYVLVMVRYPERFGKILADQKMPEGWIGAVLDRNNLIVARTHAPERFVGQPAAAGTVRSLAEKPEAVVHIVSVEGTPLVGAYSRSELSGWTVALGIPTNQLYATLWQSVAVLVATLAVLLGSSLVLAWFFGRYITRSLKDLGDSFRAALGGMAEGPIAVNGPREVARLAEDFSTMLAARNEAEDALRQSEGLYHSLFDNMLNGFAYCRMVYDGERPVDFVYLTVNRAFEAQTGLRDVEGRRVSDVIPGVRERDPGLLELYGRVARSGRPESSEVHVAALNQWLAVTVYSPSRDHFVVVFDVVTERKEQERKIARLVRLYAVLSGINSTIVRVHERQSLLESACRVAVEEGRFGMAWIGLLSDDGRYLAPVAGCGVDLRAISEVPVRLEGDGRDGQGRAQEALRTRHAVFCNDISALPRGGQVRLQALEQGYRSVCALPLVVDGQGIGVMTLYAREADFFDAEEMRLLDELAADISFALQYIERDERLNYLAYYDALTGLPNRTLFQDRLRQLILGAQAEHVTVAAILVDLDRFAHVNETYGRHVGDALLQQVGERLQGALAEPFSLARIGADKFAVALGNLGHGGEAAIVVEERIFAALSRPFQLEDLELHVTAHAGIALFPGDGEEAESLYQSAEVALKEAQLAGARLLHYAPEINTRISVSLNLEQELRSALEDGQFLLHYQPRVDLCSGRIVGAEALIRWQHPERGLVSPADFIPLAERTGLIVPIGAWVIETVCAQQARWLRDGLSAVPVAVNLSPVQFAHGNLLVTLQSALARHGLAAGYLELELTESLVMRNPEESAAIMHDLRQCGLRLSLDDFGTGYSSLAYLHRFPFDFVKIDRAFVGDITQNPGNAAIATAVIAMAHRLNLQVVAEGVENEGQLHYLCRHDCDQIQGYYFSPPVVAAAFAGMLADAKCLDLDNVCRDGSHAALVADGE